MDIPVNIPLYFSSCIPVLQLSFQEEIVGPQGMHSLNFHKCAKLPLRKFIPIYNPANRMEVPKEQGNELSIF